MPPKTLSIKRNCHPERTGPQTHFSLGVVSREPALSVAEGDLLLHFVIHTKNFRNTTPGSTINRTSDPMANFCHIE
jgi:hypothetical protein